MVGKYQLFNSWTGMGENVAGGAGNRRAAAGIGGAAARDGVLVREAQTARGDGRKLGVFVNRIGPVPGVRVFGGWGRIAIIITIATTTGEKTSTAHQDRQHQQESFHDHLQVCYPGCFADPGWIPMSPVFYQPRGEDGNRERKKNEKRTVTVRVHGRLEPGHPR
jgi:hypothetical protein